MESCQIRGPSSDFILIINYQLEPFVNISLVWFLQ